MKKKRISGKGKAGIDKSKFSKLESDLGKKSSTLGRKFDRASLSKVSDRKPYIGPNDIAWRTGDEVMTRLVANLPFGFAAGLSQDINVNGYDGEAGVNSTYRQPGIMTVVTKLTAGTKGVSGDQYNSPANLAFRKIYSFVRHANSGSRNYEAADIALYCLSIAQVLGLLGWLQRLLRLTNEYSATNRYTPRALVRAMGVDIVDIQNNQPQLKYLIAWLGRSIGSIAFPNMPYFTACYEAYKYVIVDNDSPKEQFYLLNSSGFGVYNPTYSTAGGGMSYTGTNAWNDGSGSTLMTFATLAAYVRERMNVLLGDEDCGIISGDILKAFPSDVGLFKPEAFGDDYEVFIKSEELLQQIHNCNVIDEDTYVLKGYHQRAGSTNTAPYIEPDTLAGSTTWAKALMFEHKFAVDAFSREPDPKEVVNCSVLNPVGYAAKNAPADTYRLYADSVCFDLHLPVKVLLFNTIGTSIPAINLTQIRRYGSSFTSNGINSDMTNFDWHPLKIYTDVDGSGNPTFVKVIGDIQNFRVFDYDVGVRIHENSMLSLLSFNEHNFLK